jgi:hypothetical protein
MFTRMTISNELEVRFTLQNGLGSYPSAAKRNTVAFVLNHSFGNAFFLITIEVLLGCTDLRWSFSRWKGAKRIL